MTKKAVVAILAVLFLYTRLTGLSWGLPYPLHPDERNMAVAIQGLTCEHLTDTASCLNPHFFAYGQVPLYLAYVGIQLMHGILGITRSITFEEATVALRIISVLASGVTAYLLYPFLQLLMDLLGMKPKRRVRQYGPFLAVLAFILSPYGVQFAHFGTTESCLMLLYLAVTYLSLRYSIKRESKYIILSALVLGLAIAVKVSSAVFLAVPAAVLLFLAITNRKHAVQIMYHAVLLAGLSGIVAAVLSPHTILSWGEFMGSFNYESSVATGSYLAFYTRQFIGTTPILFQFQNIFPFALGTLSLILFALGFLLLPWKNRNINIVRFALLVYVLPTSFLFAKWTRFMAPAFPLMTAFSTLFVLWLTARFKRVWAVVGIMIVFLLSLLPGIAYLSVYAAPDVRFEASDWIYSNIPASSKILSETANVIDIPVPHPGYRGSYPSYQYASFDFYHLDENPGLQDSLKNYLQAADYLFVPSRRVFMNHPPADYPQLKAYYDALFSGRLGFEPVKEFTAYPHISLFGKTVFELPDERAEETWTVFDHPVIRIYRKKTGVMKTDFSTYDHAVADVRGTRYRLLLADTKEKWEKGLMWVRTKKDADGFDGMIFMFPEKSIQSFWNKNTVADLDLYWLDGKKVIGKASLPSIEVSNRIVTVTSPGEVDRVIEIIK